MGKPLSRPDCLRQSPACLGKGEDEDGYIEDCYVPQRSIYDTMRINEQIDQGGKPSQPSKNTLEKADGSTLSSNGTLGVPSAFESKAPESKKLDERVIFDALKLSSDVSKSAPAPPRRRPNPEKKENVNRRSWKSFMPPNFPEFAERIEASLSEVSEVGVSNSSLQEKQGSGTRLAEEAGQRPDSAGRSPPEPLAASTTEQGPQMPNVPEIHEVQQLSDAFCGSAQDECQPLLEAGGPGQDLRCWDLLSATWPRAMKSTLKAGLSQSGRHDTLEADDTDGVVEMVPLSPCLSEELLDPGAGVLIGPTLREKTESELRFEEDERLILMEAEEALEEGPWPQGKKVAQKRDPGLTGISEERGQCSALATTVVEAEENLAGGRGTPECPSAWQELWAGSEPQAVGSSLVPQETRQDLCAADAAPGEEEEEEEEEEDGACGAKAVSRAQLAEEEADPGLGGLLVPEQFSDTDSVQMFLDLEELCMSEEDRDGATGTEGLEAPGLSPCAEGPGPQEESEQLLEISPDPSHRVALPEASVADSAVVSDLEDFDTTYGSQVASTTEPTLSESYSERETSGDSENVLFPSPPGTKDPLLSIIGQIEECGGTEPLEAQELSKNDQVEEDLDALSGGPGAVVGGSGCKGGSLSACIFWAGREVEEEMPPAPNHDDLATTAEELDSQVDLDLMKFTEDSGGKELSAHYEQHHSERTDFSNWDVPELVSEDEVADLDKETFLSGGHTDERRDAESARVPFHVDFTPWQALEELTSSPEDPEEAGASWSGQLEGLAKPPGGGEAGTCPGSFGEEWSKMEEQVVGGSSPAQERDAWEHGDLERLFGQGGVVEVRGGEWSAEGVWTTSSPLVPAEDLHLSVEDAFFTAGGDAASASPLASNEDGYDAPWVGTEDLSGTVAGLPAIVGPAEATESMFSSLPTLFVGESVVDATNEDLGGPDGPSVATSVPVWSSMEEISCPSPPLLSCVENWPTTPSKEEEKPTPEEVLEGEEGAGTSEDLIQASQELEDLDNLSALQVETLEAEVGPPELEGSSAVLPQVLWTPGGTLPSSPLLPASTAPGTEEQLTSAMPGGEGPSSSTTSTTFLAAEVPPDGLVPDNEVLVSWLHTGRLIYPFGWRWEEVRSRSIVDLTDTM